MLFQPLSLTPEFIQSQFAFRHRKINLQSLNLLLNIVNQNYSRVVLRDEFLNLSNFFDLT